MTDIVVYGIWYLFIFVVAVTKKQLAGARHAEASWIETVYKNQAKEPTESDTRTSFADRYQVHNTSKPTYFINTPGAIDVYFTKKVAKTNTDIKAKSKHLLEYISTQAQQQPVPRPRSKKKRGIDEENQKPVLLQL